MSRIKINDILDNAFYQLPKTFYCQGSKYFVLSNNAKVLYALLKDRLNISIKNNWINNDNEVFLIMTRNEMCELLGVCENNARKAIKELIEIGLIEEFRQGLNKPNLIFLNKVEFDYKYVKKDRKDVESTGFKGHSKNEVQDTQKMSPINTNINNTDVSFKVSDNLIGSSSINIENNKQNNKSPIKKIERKKFVKFDKNDLDFDKSLIECVNRYLNVYYKNKNGKPLFLSRTQYLKCLLFLDNAMRELSIDVIDIDNAMIDFVSYDTQSKDFNINNFINPDLFAKYIIKNSDVEFTQIYGNDGTHDINVLNIDYGI